MNLVGAQPNTRRDFAGYGLDLGCCARVRARENSVPSMQLRQSPALLDGYTGRKGVNAEFMERRQESRGSCSSSAVFNTSPSTSGTAASLLHQSPRSAAYSHGGVETQQRSNSCRLSQHHGHCSNSKQTNGPNCAAQQQPMPFARLAGSASRRLVVVLECEAWLRGLCAFLCVCNYSIE